MVQMAASRSFCTANDWLTTARYHLLGCALLKIEFDNVYTPSLVLDFGLTAIKLSRFGHLSFRKKQSQDIVANIYSGVYYREKYQSDFADIFDENHRNLRIITNQLAPNQLTLRPTNSISGLGVEITGGQDVLRAVFNDLPYGSTYITVFGADAIELHRIE